MNRANHGPVLERLDLNLLVTFEAVYRERNLTRAAKRLFVTQSAVSHALARLLLSARAYHRVLRVARSFADLR